MTDNVRHPRPQLDVWCNANWSERWLANLAAQQPRFDRLYIVGTATGEPACAATDVVNAVRQFDSIGIRAIPGVSHVIDARFGGGVDQWSREVIWQRAADYIGATCGPLKTREFVLDVEPYLSGARYPSPLQAGAIVHAMRPLIAAIGEYRIQLLLAPYRWRLLAALILGAFDVRAVGLDETTYHASTEQIAQWQWLLREREPTICGMREYRMQDAAFLADLVRSGVERAWVRVEGAQGDYWRFGRPDWSPRP